MTQTEELLKLSIIYRTLINDIEMISGANFDPTQKHRMTQVISDGMGEAIMIYVARCSRCDSRIELVCAECGELEALDLEGH